MGCTTQLVSAVYTKQLYNLYTIQLKYSSRRQEQVILHNVNSRNDSYMPCTLIEDIVLQGDMALGIKEYLIDI